MNKDTCPCCEREFSIMFEYPSVHLLSVNKTALPPNLSFPFKDKTKFIPFSENIENRLPDKVAFHFGEVPGVKRAIDEVRNFLGTKGISFRGYEFKHEGWWWAYCGSRGPMTIKNDAGISCYTRSTLDNKADALPHMNSYLNSLEKLVGKEIAPSLLLPDFEVDAMFKSAYLTVDSPKYKNRFRIPRCDLLLDFRESEKNPEGNRRIDIHLLDDDSGADVIDLSHGWGGPLKQVVAVCAELEYKGLLKSH